MRTDIIKVVHEIKIKKIDFEYCSPDLVAAIAYRMGSSLSCEEVVYISDNIEILIEEL